MIDYQQKFRLDNKTAFVVGGLGLIGSEITKALASAGASVISLDINCEKGKVLKFLENTQKNQIHDISASLMVI